MNRMTSRSHTIRIRIVLYNVLPESYSSFGFDLCSCKS